MRHIMYMVAVDLSVPIQRYQSPQRVNVQKEVAIRVA